MSIKYKFIIPVVVLFVFILMGISFYIFNSIKNEQANLDLVLVKNLTSELKKQEKALSDSIRNKGLNALLLIQKTCPPLLYDEDIDKVIVNTQAFEEDADIQRVDILNEDGENITHPVEDSESEVEAESTGDGEEGVEEKGEVESPELASLIILEEDLTFIDGDEKINVGHVKITLTREAVLAQISALQTRNATMLSKIQNEGVAFLDNLLNSIIGVAVGSSILLLFVIVLIVNKIIQPVKDATESLRQIAEGDGDLTARLRVQSQDEIGRMCHYFNDFTSSIQTIIETVKNRAALLDGISKEMSASSSTAAAEVDELATQTNIVAAATEEMSVNCKTMAESADHISNDASLASNSSEAMKVQIDKVFHSLTDCEVDLKQLSDNSSEINDKINGIMENVVQGREVSQEAVESVNNATEKVDLLDKSSQEIEEVVNIIVEISEQIKNLSLNATIEAARAGEAGKGFAVVANEVKDLARQTSDSTEEIKKRVLQIRNSTTATVDEISKISGVIGTLEKVVESIDSSVSTQREAIERNSTNASNLSVKMTDLSEIADAANKEVETITNSIIVVAEGTSDVSSNTQQGNDAIGEISCTLQTIKMEVDKGRDRASQINAASEKMAGVASELSDLVDRFKV
jgi:methyl-accepting chemotaxis protein